jgi:hypothetical protein
MTNVMGKRAVAAALLAFAALPCAVSAQGLQ